MSAGTIVIAGGILAGVILLCIVAVLCYCRLQYYCCKKNDSEADAGSPPQADPLAHFPCNTCNALANDGAAITPVSLDQLDCAAASASHRGNACRACSPYTRRAALAAPEMLNGGERLGFHTYYENPAASLPQCSTPSLSYYGPADLFPPPRSYSTQV
ncbi:protein FAM163A-like [Entelurus aequoreus]|uniref:protein FAM163A-like n=1 Tax=Entelurus aequoreus TaxID=161455 RepID=UPI002B1D7CE0|nr:protein FAM163A-like [Entelurus aequoreus]XP_061896395.1 protein FAM163A-like [Entelurus aequoreus]XP_061896396.1 protein FAM163A-like [Entelurus aequoreus]